MSGKFPSRSVALFIFGVALVGLILLKNDNLDLEKRIAELRQRNELTVRSHDEAQRVPSLRDELGKNLDVTAGGVLTELERARNEVAALERHAQETLATKATRISLQTNVDASALALNQNPELGLTKLENFRNVGRSTPGAALQTLVWAAMKGDYNLLAESMAVSGVARQRAEALISVLPESERSESTPEKLAALWFAQTVLNVSAAQISGQTVTDPTHATLSVRGGIGAGGQVSMQLGSNGWQMVVPAQALESAQIKLGITKPH